MNLDELRSVQSKERQKDSLQHLRDSFYADVAEYVADRKATRDRAAEEADDPFGSPEVRRLTDEIETAEEVAEAIYERRMGKLVKQASLAAAGMSADEEGLTAEERELFTDLVDRIQANKAHVLDVLSGDVEASAAGSDVDPVRDAGAEGADPSEAAPTPGTDRPETERAPPTDDARRDGTAPADPSPAEEQGSDPSPQDGVSAADVMGGEDPAGGATLPGDDETPAATGPSNEEDAPSASPSGPAPEAAADDSQERVTLRITRDVGEILGVDDREYDLASEDVVSLPAQNAEPLVQRDAAEKLD